MSEAYEECVEGVSLLRFAPDPRHEQICRRLHGLLETVLSAFPTSRRLEPRSSVTLNSNSWLRPDLAVVTAANSRLWLAAEIVSAGDHQADTVTKKACYEDWRVPRLWMIDPRYDNVEVYHATEYGLMLKGILAGDQVLREALLPGFECSVNDLFASKSGFPE